MAMLILMTFHFWQVLVKSGGMLVSTFTTEIRGAPHWAMVSIAKKSRNCLFFFFFSKCFHQFIFCIPLKKNHKFNSNALKYCIPKPTLTLAASWSMLSLLLFARWSSIISVKRLLFNRLHARGKSWPASLWK